MNILDKDINYTEEAIDESNQNKTHKSIIDAAIARKLIKLGNHIADIKPLKEPEDMYKKPTNFIFRITDKLKIDYKEITGRDLKI